MFFFPHHIGDYRSATMHLSNEEDLAYRRLLDMYYDSEKPIPLDVQWVARRIRVGVDVVSSVLADFFLRTDDGWRSSRCEREIAAYHGRAQTARANGKKGGRKKTNPVPTPNPPGNPVGSDWVPGGSPKAPGSQANQEPVTLSVTKVTGGEPPDDHLDDEYGAPPGPAGPVDPEMTDREKVFHYGVPILVSAGTPEKSARSFLAGAAKQHTEAAVVQALRSCIRERAIDPLSWLAKQLPPKASRNGHRFDLTNYQEGVNEDGTFG